MTALFAAAVMMLAALAFLPRLFAGPTLYDRALAAGSLVSKLALVSAALAVALGRADWLNLAFALLLGGFVANAAMLRFYRLRSFQAPASRDDVARAKSQA
jgi:multicomponent Na+:H+ antiporter subunit F